jgi:aspartyl-tRNA(Asn)/glutamyl-tRNA(Gln) amidotransferase subunit A
VTDLASLTVGALAPQLRSRAVSPVEVTRAVLDRVDRLEPVLRSYVTVRAEEALDAARHAEDEIARGRWRGPMHGIPIGIKDCIAVAGWPTTNGSALMTHHVTLEDAAAVERIRAAGAVIVGKHNMHEWAMGGTCTGMRFGTVRNPWDAALVPGGSSGGSAAAVSAGLAIAALGTDGLGSIRTPASYCGIVGIKPTAGLVSRHGEVPASTSPFSVVGPLARDVTDAALLLAAIAGHDERDPTSRRRPDGWRVDPESLTADVRGVRVGLPRGYFLDDALPAVRSAVEAAASVLEDLGASVREVDLPSLPLVALTLPANQTEAQEVLLPLALDHPEGFASRDIRNRILAAEFVRAADVRHALWLRSRIRSEFAAVMADVDVLLTPTNSTPPFEIGAPAVPVGTHGDIVEMGVRGGQARLTTRLTMPFNVTGMPAISLPAAVPVGAAPIGLQLAAGAWQEPLLLSVALGLEHATTGGYIEPPIASGGSVPVPGELPQAAALGATR